MDTLTSLSGLIKLPQFTLITVPVYKKRKLDLVDYIHNNLETFSDRVILLNTSFRQSVCSSRQVKQYMSYYRYKQYIMKNLNE